MHEVGMNGATEVVESWGHIVRAMERDWSRFRPAGAGPERQAELLFAPDTENRAAILPTSLSPPGMGAGP